MSQGGGHKSKVINKNISLEKKKNTRITLSRYAKYVVCRYRLNTNLLEIYEQE